MIDSRPSLLWTSLGIAGAVLAVSGSAHADQAEAQRLFREGVELIKADRIADAEAKLQASWDLYETYDTAANLAEAEAKLGQRAEAAQHMDFAVRHLPNHIVDDMRTAMQQRARELRAEVGTLRIVVSADGAAVKVGGRPVGRSPIADDVFVEPGEIAIEAVAEGGGSAATRVTVGKGERKEARLELAASGVPPVTPPPPDSERASSPWPPVLLIGGASVAVIGLGVGITGLVVAGGKGSDADDQLAAISESGGRCPDAPGCAELDETLGDEATFKDVTLVGFVGMGVGLTAVSVGLVLLATSDERSANATIAPAPAPPGSDLGGSLRLRF